MYHVQKKLYEDDFSKLFRKSSKQFDKKINKVNDNWTIIKHMNREDEFKFGVTHLGCPLVKLSNIFLILCILT